MFCAICLAIRLSWRSVVNYELIIAAVEQMEQLGWLPTSKPIKFVKSAVHKAFATKQANSKPLRELRKKLKKYDLKIDTQSDTESADKKIVSVRKKIRNVEVRPYEIKTPNVNCSTYLVGNLLKE